METRKNLSDAELLQLMLTGDAEALATLYERRQRNIYRFALQMSGSTTIAEDITQEVFLVLIHNGASFDIAKGSLNNFLLGVARNHVLRRLQRERFYAPMIETEEHGEHELPRELTSSGGPLDDLARTETIESVRKAVLALPERYREVVVLCDLQEMSYVETAEILGCAVGTVRSRLHRARTLLINKLRPAREAEPAAADLNSKRCFA
jgi:RNA polymerase sigma-70 factor (ECF subfamily)